MNDGFTSRCERKFFASRRIPRRCGERRFRLAARAVRAAKSVSFTSSATWLAVADRLSEAILNPWLERSRRRGAEKSV